LNFNISIYNHSFMRCNPFRFHSSHLRIPKSCVYQFHEQKFHLVTKLPDLAPSGFTFSAVPVAVYQFILKAEIRHTALHHDTDQ